MGYELRDRIRGLVVAAAAGGSLAEEEKAVLRCIVDAWREGRRVTQRDIARTERWLGCHPAHESDVVADRWETTTRRVRGIVRDLRVRHDLPVIDYRDGYTLPSTMEEAEEFLRRKEREARARAASSIETYHALNRSLGVRSEAFDQLSLLPAGAEG